MIAELVSDELWEYIEPLLPARSAKLRGGRRRACDRSELEGILYVLRTGIPWGMLPEGFGLGGVTCWRRLRDWQEAGVWKRLHQVLLDEIGKAGLVEWSRGLRSTWPISRPKGASRPAPTP